MSRPERERAFDAASGHGEREIDVSNSNRPSSAARHARRLVPAGLCLLAAALAGPALASAGPGEETRLLRFADIHEDRIAFVYAGDIWIVDAGGGTATRLTTDIGMELFPKFSPDGRRIAFSGEYGGNRQVFVIDVEGGAPRQLTYYNDVGSMPPRGGFDYRVLDWTPDGRHVLVRANRLPWGVRMGRYYLVPADGGTEEPLPVPEGGGGMLSPDGRTLVYTPIDREFRTWKRYRGGRAQDVWTFDLDTMQAERLTDHPGTDNQPLRVGDTIYFTSDRERRLNLYALDPGTKTVEQVTHHEDFDVLWPSAGPKRIVYECGGRLWIFDPGSRESAPVAIRVTGDFRHTLPAVRDASRSIDWFDISPTGRRALFAARGDLFTVPAEKGQVRNISRTGGERELYPAWSPDGTTIAYLSDRTGEYEIWLRPRDGRGEPRQLTRDGSVWRFAPAWSPDGSKIAWSDRDQRLRYLHVDSGRVVDVDRSPRGDIRTYRWSPDGRFLVFVKEDASEFSSIFLHELANGRTSRLTDAWTNDVEPVFDPEGRFLYFLSDRDWNLTFSGYEFNYLYTRPTRVYAATLAADGPALLAPKSDDEDAEPAAEEDSARRGKAADEAKAAGKETPADVRVDVEGFAERVVALPAKSGSYSNLRASSESVFVLEGNGQDAKIRAFQVEDEKLETVLEGASAFEISRDGKKLVYRSGRNWGIVDARPGQKPGGGRLDLSGMTLEIDPRLEWRQIFADATRITRDWFYDPGLHGVDWAAMRELYAPLVAHVAHRADLDYVLGEMGGELAAGHYYVNWGDMPRPERRNGGLLGAEIVPEAGVFRVASIYPGENWHPEYRSPLTEPGADVAEGDYILAVDGVSTRGVPNFYSLLQGKADRAVTLTVSGRPDGRDARDTTVRPIARETKLRYLAWVRSRRERVDRLSGGRIGYIHLPNTAIDGNRELRRQFYPQAHKDALIFDVRYNGGGFIPDRMIELLARPQLSYWKRRHERPDATPGYSHAGPKACLINAYSSSGGDAFPYYFRKLGLGPLIGSRTWGGLIGLSGNPSFADGGSVSVPTFRFLDTEGNWAVENVGVEPDIEVLDRPDLVARGEDPTLDKAVEVLLAELEQDPPRRLVVPPAPRIER